VNPHLVRKIAATELAIHDPAHIGVAQRLLDHANPATTEEYYDLAQSIDAARRVHQTLGALRQEAVKGVARPTRTPVADASKEDAR
jgi:integrase